MGRRSRDAATRTVTTGSGRRRPGPALTVCLAFGAGSVPFSQLAARAFAGADLRRVGTGTVSGTGLYEVAGFGPLALAGVFEVAKGAVGPAVAGRRRPWLAAAATAAAISAHNWSPWLGGAGGRGIAPALGATAVIAPEATGMLLVGMVGGRLAHQSGVATLAAVAGLVPLLGRRGAPGVALALAVTLPMVVKRLAGNRPATGSDRRAILRSRLLFDRDPT